MLCHLMTLHLLACAVFYLFISLCVGSNSAVTGFCQFICLLSTGVDVVTPLLDNDPTTFGNK